MADPVSASLLLTVAIVALVLPVAYWVLRPLIAGTLPTLPPDPKAVALLSEREAALASLRDLDADLRDGRIGEEGHAKLRAVLVDRAARVLEALDVLSEEREGESSALAEALEQQVLAARGATHSPEPASVGEAGAEPAQSRLELDTATEGEQAETRSCDHCSYRSKADARFCGGCGQAFEDAPA